MNQPTKQDRGTHLIVEAGVRYWEGATVNGEEDAYGTLIPFRRGDFWCPVIQLAVGKVVGWPIGMVANVHYKVCDAGQYWLGDATGTKQFKYGGDYVPDGLLSVGSRGYGDYIILSILADGSIDGWCPSINFDDWEDLSIERIQQ